MAQSIMVRASRLIDKVNRKPTDCPRRPPKSSSSRQSIRPIQKPIAVQLPVSVGPLWIRSDVQEQGRGRSGRPWSSPAGNLSATYMFTPSGDRAVFHQLSFVAGLAGYDAVAPFLTNDTSLQLKWPNDLMIGTAKLGGILVESSKYGADIVVMIGMGINIAVTPEITERAVTQLGQQGTAPPPQKVLQELTGTMSRWLQTWSNGDHFDAIRDAWLERAHGIGQPLTVNTNSRQLAGTFQGLGQNGALLLETPSGEVIRVEHGDVSLASHTPASKERA